MTATRTRLAPATGAKPSRAVRERILGVPTRLLRIVTLTAWAVALVVVSSRNGIPIDRNLLIAWTITGLMAASIGRRPLWTVPRDWLALAAVLVAYDLSRGAAETLGRPTAWTPQVRLEEFLFFGREPTVWLQGHLKQAEPPPWEVLVSFTYVSFFIVPYAMAGIFWLRDRALWKSYILRFVTISFIGLAGFVLFPAAPPWAAAQCTAAEVATHPANPPCLYRGGSAGNGLLGPMDVKHAGAAPNVQRIAARGFYNQGLHFAAALVNEGQAGSNQVAAIPSLHGAISLLVSVFLWPMVKRRWRPLLVAYPLVMAFSLVYGGEHYFVDVLAGWAVTTVVCVVAWAWPKWWARWWTPWWARWRRRNSVADVDTLGDGSTRPTDGESECPAPRSPFPTSS